MKDRGQAGKPRRREKLASGKLAYCPNGHGGFYAKKCPRCKASLVVRFHG
jgi:hypothetical protein